MMSNNPLYGGDLMYFSLSDGREIFKADMCAHCQLDTGGGHNPNCPLFNSIIARGNLFDSVNMHYEVFSDLSVTFKKGIEAI